MKRYRTANLIFAGSFLLFLLAVILRHWAGNLWTGVFYFLAQSCLIGCCADWFAVEALFRNRLHLPWFIPLVPRYRERIVGQLDEVVNQKLIRKEGISELIGKFSLTNFLEMEYGGIGKSIEAGMARSIGRFFISFLSEHRTDISSWVRKGGSGFIDSFSRYLSAKAGEGEYKEVLLLKILEEAEGRVRDEKVRDVISSRLKEWGDSQERGILGNIMYSLGQIGGFVIDYGQMAESIQSVMAEKIEEWKNPSHPFHETLVAEWNHAVQAFLADPAARKAVRDFAECLYESIPIEEKTDRIYERIWQEWVEGGAFEARLVPQLAGAVHQAVEVVLRDKELRVRMDWSARNLLTDVLRFEHENISGTVTEVLQAFDEKELNEFIESKVHRELEGIRINGAMVGLAAGAVLYGVIEFLWLPVVHAFFPL